MHDSADGPARVFLHIGFHKTGSSAIQAYLASHADDLAETGVIYPWHRSFDWARKGHVSSGNRASLFDPLPDSPSPLLFSSEIFFGAFRPGSELIVRLQSLGRPVTVICYARDLHGHFQSQFGQFVKRDGGGLDALAFARSYRPFAQLLQVRTLAQEMGMAFSLRNYSRLGRGVISDLIEQVLRERAADFMERFPPRAGTVNRSLTRAEARIQALFNAEYHGPSHGFVSDPLVNLLPDIAPDPFVFGPAVRRCVLDNNGAAIETLNAALPEPDRISAEFPVAAEPEADFRLSDKQLQVLVASVAGKLAAAELGQDAVDSLRDIALAIDSGAPLGRAEALALMKIAGQARPGGPVIQAKLAEWEREKDG